MVLPPSYTDNTVKSINCTKKVEYYNQCKIVNRSPQNTPLNIQMYYKGI